MLRVGESIPIAKSQFVHFKGYLSKLFLVLLHLLAKAAYLPSYAIAVATETRSIDWFYRMFTPVAP